MWGFFPLVMPELSIVMWQEENQGYPWESEGMALAHKCISPWTH